MTPSAPQALLALGGMLIDLVLAAFNEALAVLSCVAFVIVSRIMTLRLGVTTGRIQPRPPNRKE